MEHREVMESSSRDDRWTCEACGWHGTGETSQLSCEICGTQLLFVRTGPQAEYRLHVGNFAIGGGSGAYNPFDDVGDVMDDGDAATGEREQAVAALALDAAGIRGEAQIPGARSSQNRRQRLRLTRVPENVPRGSALHALPAKDLLRIATSNASRYRPTWADSTQLGGRTRSANGIEIGSGTLANVAYLPTGAEEGRAIRALESLPRNSSLSKNRSYSNAQDPSNHRVVGFQVAFSHPLVPPGASLGGGYLVGVTTTSFTAYGDFAALQQSPHFWGIDDRGNKFEGPRLRHSPRPGGLATSFTFSSESNQSEASHIADNVVFGAQEVVTIAVDFERRTLTYWKDSDLLGSLVANLPRAGHLYPVAVPFKSGVSVAITGMDECPLLCLHLFRSSWQQAQGNRVTALHQELFRQREVLIEDGKPSRMLVVALRKIFTIYGTDRDPHPASNETELNVIEASRLWYQCGMELVQLYSIIERKLEMGPPLRVFEARIKFEDFLGVIELAIRNDPVGTLTSIFAEEGVNHIFEVGDIVELVDDYSKYGNAGDGPLQSGDRGRVVEINESDNGERPSIRVLFNGLCWWYQPQALLSERSGLIHSNSVWLIRKILRSHGYDQNNLNPMWGMPVTKTSWQIGDIVVPRFTDADGDVSYFSIRESCWGRIAESTNLSSSSLSLRKSDTVLVEFTSVPFGVKTGVLSEKVEGAGPIPYLRRVRLSKLLHACSWFCSSDVGSGLPIGPNFADDNEELISLHDMPTGHCMDTDIVNEAELGAFPLISETLKADIIAISRLEREGIESVTRECEKETSSLSVLFSAGLSNAMLSAIDSARAKVSGNSGEDETWIALSSLNLLVEVITRNIFPSNEQTMHGSEARTGLKSSARHPVDAQPETMTQAPQQFPAHFTFPLPNDPDSLINNRSSNPQVVSGANEEERLAIHGRGSMLRALMSRQQTITRSPQYRFKRDDSSDSGATIGQHIDPSRANFRQRDMLPSFRYGVRPHDILSVENSWNDTIDSAQNNNRPSAGLANPGTARRLQSEGNDEAFARSLSPVRRWAVGERRAPGDGSTFFSLNTRGFEENGLGVVVTDSIKGLVTNGLMRNCLPWVQASIESPPKRTKRSSTSRPSTSHLSNARAEDGMPVILLAINLGCSLDIIRYLIQAGASVGEAEIRAAAITNQPSLLSLLLQHTACSETSFALTQCSPEVVTVLARAASCYALKQESVRREGKMLIFVLISKFCQLGLCSREVRSTESRACRQAAAEALVGNVLLHVMHGSQLKASIERHWNTSNFDDACPFVDSQNETMTSVEAGQEMKEQAKDLPPMQGLLQILPAHVLSECLLNESTQAPSSARSFLFLFVESLLWSKGSADSALGLTFLMLLLQKVPEITMCPEIGRYGLKYLVLSHKLLAQSSLGEIEARRHHTDNVSASTRNRQVMAEPSNSNTLSPTGYEGVVLCPKRHIAGLHLTRHSSFRCDLCGKSVERGRPMHGCRTCDWDACEDCTDKTEGGAAKWGYIVDLSVKCEQLLYDAEVVPPLDIAGDDIMRNDRKNFQNLASLIRERDEMSFQKLVHELESPGGVTMFEFASEILPALHDSVVSKAVGCVPSVDGLDLGRRTKKQRLRMSCSELERDMEDPYFYKADVTRCTVHKRDLFRRKVVSFLVNRSERVNQEAVKEFDSDLANSDNWESNEFIGVRPKLNNDERHFSIIPRLQEILSFSERLQIVYSSDNGGGPDGTGNNGLQCLTRPLELELRPSLYCNSSLLSMLPSSTTVVLAEPLMPFAELELHILRTFKITDMLYVSFCKRLASDQAIIVERPSPVCAGRGESESWKIAQITGYDDNNGSHTVRYASYICNQDTLQGRIELRQGGVGTKSLFSYDDEEMILILAAREYYVLHDKNGHRYDQIDRTASNDNDLARGLNSTVQNNPNCTMRGKRVASNCGSTDGTWRAYTVLSQSEIVQTEHVGGDEENYAGSVNLEYDIVSDLGEVFRGVAPNQIRMLDSSGGSMMLHTRDQIGRNLSLSDSSSDFGRHRNQLTSRAFPFFAVRRSVPDQNVDSVQAEPSAAERIGILKRTWSALSFVHDRTPLDINVPKSLSVLPFMEPGREKVWTCSVGDAEIDLLAEDVRFENQPRLQVELSANADSPTVNMSTAYYDTVFCALRRLMMLQTTSRIRTVFFRVRVACHSSNSGYEKCSASNVCDLQSQRRQLSLNVDLPQHSDPGKLLIAQWADPVVHLAIDEARVLVNNQKREQSRGLCQGLDEVATQCLDLLNELASCIEEESLSQSQKMLSGGTPQRVEFSMFESRSLSNKLTEQLDDALIVAGGALPEWCLIAPSCAPRTFSYASRRLLLMRAAFGVSRSTLKLQESKVAVGSLRQRMAALRGRAVELVSEAFSGGAHDPMALQLQADELYGMEEALAARVNAAFNAQKWSERSLQCVKAVVRRETLLADAASVMERYAKDTRMCRRRLEVRFSGESGFDAASGDEAGVTRGFYADVAEALLSCSHVSPLYVPVSCRRVNLKHSLDEDANLTGDDLDFPCHMAKLPLWIPDVDSSRQVVIPTPRANPNSTLCVYPRPLSPNDPCIEAVLKEFRFMGRLFAAAMRDGFMFPLPFSSAFLKLVQSGVEPWSFASDGGPDRSGTGAHPRGITIDAKPMSWLKHDDRLSAGDAKPTDNSDSDHFERCIVQARLISADLPRPGFLGGDVFAVESYICEALDKIDMIDPPLPRSEVDRLRQEISTDRRFSRLALGKNYDCSFEEYFQDRTFVDPLDPAQGEEALPLCPNGHLRPVTIHNVREWVALAKYFILYSGVIKQALAFRQGVDDFFNADYLRIFTPKELQLDVCGGGDNVDTWDAEVIRNLFKLDGGKGAAEALVAVAAMGGEGGSALSRRFGPSSPTIGFLVKTLLECTPTQRRQFLSFVTSVPIVTPGKIEIVPMVSSLGEFLPMRDPACLPRANTCARRLYLPKFDDYETFSKVILSVAREESKFKGFYEWRG